MPSKRHSYAHVLTLAAAICIAGSAAAKDLAPEDANFLDKAAQAGHVEMQSGSLALEKASSTNVKRYAQQMLIDHEKMANDLQILARSKGHKLPVGPAAAQRAQLESLGSNTGGAFDRRYSRTVGVQAHQETIALFEQAASTAKDGDVEAFARKSLPALRHHLEMARPIDAAVHDSAAVGNAAK